MTGVGRGATRTTADGGGFHSSDSARRYARDASFVFSHSATEPVVRLLAPRAGEWVLDLGCGTGELTARIAHAVGASPSAQHVRGTGEASEPRPDADCVGGQTEREEGRVVALDASADMCSAARVTLAGVATHARGPGGGEESVGGADGASGDRHVRAKPSQSRDAPPPQGGESLRGVEVHCVDCQELVEWLDRADLAGRFDKVLSNAALHWMKRSPEDVVRGVGRALKPGGVFAAEMGGFLNVVGIRGALHAALRRRGIDPDAVDPWYFPTAEEYSELLGRHGFDVQHAELVPRITPLPNESGLEGWLRNFAGAFFNALPPSEHRGLLDEVIEASRPDMYDAVATRNWTLMYCRLRIRATKRSS